jgi:hypothetical protein
MNDFGIYQTYHRRTLGNAPLCQRWASEADNGRGDKPKVFTTKLEAIKAVNDHLLHI